MILRELLQRISHTLIQGSEETEITGIVCDSKQASPSCLFVALKGSRSDGCDYIGEAVRAGAAAIVAERVVTGWMPEADRERGVGSVPEDGPGPVPETAVSGGAAALHPLAYVRVDDSRAALSALSAVWFGEPSRRMTMIGVTGTKGKTTTAAMMKQILEEAGIKAGLIGTTGVWVGEEHHPTVNTTPESLEIHSCLRRMWEAGCQAAVMEVSSQGLMMHRVDDIFFDYGIFTNISPDHIGPGEHADFAEYLECKSRLLRRCRVGVVNRDDAHFEEIVREASCKLVTFALKKPADWQAQQIDYRTGHGFMGVSFEAVGQERFPVEAGVPGLFNVYNALAAVALSETMGLRRDAVCRALKKVSVSGRMELVCAGERLTALVDYAHNAVSLESLLDTLRSYRPKRLICVFGCGGNRSRLRRYEMGEISGRKADLTVITADNSRWERVESIMNDIRTGVRRTGGVYAEIADRREAIEFCVAQARDGDMIAVAGKGHEDYQEVCGVRTPFSDREELLAALKKYGYV